MRLLAPLLAWLLLGASAWAQDTAHHSAFINLDPARGDIQVQDLIQVSGQGPTAFTLSPAFTVQSLKVDGHTQDPERHDGQILVELGRTGTHEIQIITRATLSGTAQPPFLTVEGGLVAGGWLAHPKDRLATWTLTGETPSGQKWLTAGRLMVEDATKDRYRASFSETRPSPLPILITGPFTIAEHETGDVRVRTYFHDELTPLSDGYLQDAAGYIERYAAQIGPYPYDGFSIVSAPVPVGWGLPGITYMGRRVLALPFIRSTSLPHEVLHNWWGNAVEVDYASGNWAEGLTTYLADYAQAQDGGRDMRLGWLRNYSALPQQRDMALTSFTSRSHDASQVVGYGKTAMVFHMLKSHLGDEIFAAALQDFYNTQRTHTAGWTDIEAAFSTAAGQDLSAFFDTWVTRPGAPELTLKDAHADGARITFTLTQSQDGDAYPLTVPVTLGTQNGDQRLTVTQNVKVQTHTLGAEAQVTELSIDPDFDVFRRLDAGEAPAIFRDVTLNPGTRLIVAGNNAEIKSVARQLAARLLQRDVRVASPALPLSKFNIIAGLEADVEAFLDQAGFAPPPSPVSAPAAGRAYVLREDSGRTTMVVMARDLESLTHLARALPHYKGRSYVVSDSRKVVTKGVWQNTKSPLSRAFP